VSAKPDDKGPAASSSKGNKDTKDSSASSAPAASVSVGSKPETSKPETPKPESAGSSSQASATKEEKAEAKTAAKSEKTTASKAKPKLTGAERAAAAQARKDAKLPTSNYIIVFKADADLDAEVRGIGNLKATVGKRFENAFKGVTVRLNEKQLAGLSNNPNIAIIEKDSSVALVEPLAVSTQANAPWGLDRIDQLTGRDSTYKFSVSGAGVSAYVIDTGILSTHANFGGRVASGFSSIAGGTEDCNGHGTHVAGTIGSADYGVAKSVRLVPVRVLDCNGSGTISGVIAGVDWVASQTSVGVKVANMSLGGGASSALDSAVNGLISKGVTVVVAAGNNGANACNYSPARVPAAITVAASTSSDSLASYSNTGSCVDIIAPGSAIVSTWHTGSSAVNTISGTSMAAPHVAGAVALFYQQFGFRSPAEMSTLVKTKATKSVVSGVSSGTANLLLHTDPENKIPLAATEEVVTSPTSPTKGSKKPRRTSKP
jgi:subtilisin family serine protease